MNKNMGKKIAIMGAMLPLIFSQGLAGAKTNPLIGVNGPIANYAETKQGAVGGIFAKKRHVGRVIKGPGNNTKGSRPDKPRWLRRILDGTNKKHNLKAKWMRAQEQGYIHNLRFKK
jgi:hypothetical protein